MAEAALPNCELICVEECEAGLELPDESLPGGRGELDHGVRGVDASFDTKRPTLRDVRVCPAIGKLKSERTDDARIGLRKDVATTRQESWKLTSVKPVEIDRAEPLLVHRGNVAAGPSLTSAGAAIPTRVPGERARRAIGGHGHGRTGHHGSNLRPSPAHTGADE